MMVVRVVVWALFLLATSCAVDEPADAAPLVTCNGATCASGDRCIDYAGTWACVASCATSADCGPAACCSGRDRDQGPYCVDRRDPLGRGGAECLP